MDVNWNEDKKIIPWGYTLTPEIPALDASIIVSGVTAVYITPELVS